MPSLSSARKKFTEDMRREMPSLGFIGDYLNWIRNEDPVASDRLEADLVATFTSPEGLRVLKLFEKSILYRPIPDGVSDCALREANAVRNLILEIRRLVSNAETT